MPIPKDVLISTHQLLHLTHHRNKNQHRLSKWYKSFSVLRRQISKLITELEAFETAELYSTPSTPRKGTGLRARESKYVKAARERVESRVGFLKEWVVGDAYLAFSSLVADNQYSALGLVLLGSLARINTVLGQLIEDEEDVGFEATEEAKGAEVLDARGDDLGEPVKREEITGFDDRCHDVEGENELVGTKEVEREEEQPAAKNPQKTEKITVAKQGKRKFASPRIDKYIVEERGDYLPDEEAQNENEDGRAREPDKKARRREDGDQGAAEEPQKLTMENLLELERATPGFKINKHNRPPNATVGSKGPRKARKKRKNGDAFDDLFSSLI
jgi:ribonuclease MRP protein subunit RMP1